MAEMFNVNIAIYEKKFGCYQKFAYCYSINNYDELIRLNYINKNHFEILYEKKVNIFVAIFEKT